jgi:DNA-binding MarR family transcriptional regulator
MVETPAPLIVPALERATHAVALWIERSLQDLHITQAEAHVLGYLAHAQQCSINDLHASFGHRRSTLTSILDRLEQRGLVRRGPHPASRRLVMVQLTDAGHQAGKRISAILHGLDAVVRERTGAGDVDAFSRVIEAIEEGVK